MRKTYSAFLVFAVLGCGLQPPPPSTGDAPKANADFAQPTGQQIPLTFDPKLTLKWPGKPSETSQISTTENGPEKHYSAMFTDKQAAGVTLYSAFVEELPDKTIKDVRPKELLTAYVLGSKSHETSRKEIEHGSKKCPGFEISTRTGNQFGRKLVVMVGSRIYEVSVASKTEEAVKAPAVKAFLESLAVGD